MLIAFLIGVGTMCAITTALAALMLIADSTIANYGEVEIAVNDRNALRVAGGRPLLSTLKDEKVFIPSACGGRGSCGLCKVKILEGASQIVPTEAPWLTDAERKANLRLACQVKVKRPLRIWIPEELFSVNQYETVVSSIRDLTHDIKEVRLKLADPPSIAFTAGQYIQFEVPEYDLTDEPVYRAYSISSDPRESGEIELEIRYVPHGICTTYVHRHLKAGDRVRINGPYGEFGLRPSDREILFVAGGSGMAPIKSILLTMLAAGNPRKARYFFGAKARRDLFLVDEMRELEHRLPNFTFIPALSGPEPGDRWDGETGLITDVVARHVQTVGDCEAYLCGSPLMIDACVKVLTARGMTNDRVYYDKFA